MGSDPHDIKMEGLSSNITQNRKRKKKNNLKKKYMKE
jgi:hypothetical protein